MRPFVPVTYFHEMMYQDLKVLSAAAPAQAGSDAGPVAAEAVLQLVSIISLQQWYIYVYHAIKLISLSDFGYLSSYKDNTLQFIISLITFIFIYSNINRFIYKITNEHCDIPRLFFTIKK
jgi:hypothetical protein